MSEELGEINFNKPVLIELNRATVVILGEVLENFTDNLLEKKEIDQAQAMAMWHLENAIESVCVDSFRTDYEKILTGAKKSMGEFK